jgi:hypothetical protein
MKDYDGGKSQAAYRKQQRVGEEVRKKKVQRPTPKMPRLALWDYLRTWDIVRHKWKSYKVLMEE